MSPTLVTAIISALWTLESGRAVFPPDGKDGEVGPLQIKQSFIQEVNKGLSLKNKFYDWDRKDLFQSKKIVSVWLNQRWKDAGEKNLEQIGLEWNCGRTGSLAPTPRQVEYSKKFAALVREEMKK